MATSSISGLVSGLDTASIIDQLMQLEAVSQNRLKTQQTAQKSVLSALQSLNTDVLSLATKAGALAKPETWQTLKATSSSTDITGTAGAGALAGTYSVTVDSLAAPHQLGFINGAAMNTSVVTGAAVRVTKSDTTVVDVPTSGGTLAEVVTALNAASAQTGVTANAVLGPDGSYHLLVQSTATGKDSSFTLTNTDGTDLLGGATVSAGRNAQVNLGAGITATSSTNTFTNLTSGVTVTLAPSATVNDVATITVAQDASGVKASVKALVDQVNTLLTKIDTQSANSTSTSSAGVLSGDATVRSLRSALVNTVFGGANSTTTMIGVGLQTDRDGMLVFDEAAFDKAYAADPAAVAAQFTTGSSPVPGGWAARLQTVANAASDSRIGTLTTAITGRQTSIDQLGDDITDWDDRLALRRDSLTRQFTALETALSTMQSQGNWLAGQIAQLPSSSS